MSYGAGARSLGMGKTYVGIADDASAVYWNPAGLAQLTKQEISLLHATMYENSGYDFLSYAHPFGQSAFGISLVNFSSTGFQLRNEFNVEQGEGGLNEAAGLVSLAHSWRLFGENRMNIGTTIKLVRQNVDTNSDTGYGIDAGLLWGGGPFSIGLSVQNILAPKITLIEDTDRYPVSATLGLGYRLFSGKWLIAVAANKTENRNVKIHFGTEFNPVNVLALRAGIDETEVSAGFGFKWQNYSLDYAFGYHDAVKGAADLGTSHRFGLTVKFGAMR